MFSLLSNTPKACLSACDSSQHATYLAYGGLVIAGIIYGCWTIVAHEAMARGANPFVFAFYRCAGCAALLITALRLFPGLIGKDKDTGGFADIVRPLKNDTRTFLLLGVLLGLNLMGMILGCKYLAALTCAVFAPSVPVITMIATWYVGMEVITPLKLGSILCSVAGALTIIVFSVQPSAHQASSPGQALLGMTFMVVNVCAVGGGIVFQKKGLQTYSPVLINTLSYLVAAVLIFIPALASAGFDSGNWSLKNDSDNWMAVAYAVFLTSSFNYSVMAFANKITTPTTVALSTTLLPLSSALASFILFGTAPNEAQVAGGLAIIAGLLLYVRSQTDFGAPNSASKDGDESSPLDANESSRTNSYGAYESRQP